MNFIVKVDNNGIFESVLLIVKILLFDVYGYYLLFEFELLG